jgi:CTP:molybdopterin cytidylyltransferase MocA
VLHHEGGSAETASQVDTAPQASRGVVGVLLAAGAGRRAGGPKALRYDRNGTSWLLRSVAVLLDGGCETVVVVLGCAADRARDLLAASRFGSDRQVVVVEEPAWAEGLATSVGAGLRAAPPQRAVLVHLVDLPDVTADVVRRVLRHATAGPGALARADYGGQPGHPVLIGTDHLDGVLAGLQADRGANDYLRRHRVEAVPCGDLATGRDRDTSHARPPDYPS